MKNLISGLILVLVLISTDLRSQNLFSNLKSPLKRADRLFEEFAYASAIDLYLQVLNRDKSNDQVKLKIAESYRMLNQTKEAEIWYEKVMTSSITQPIHKFYYAQMLVSNGKYEEGRKWFEEYKRQVSHSELANNMIEALLSINSFYEDSLTYPVKELKINTPHADFSPVYYEDGILFVSGRTKNVFVKALNTWDNSTFLDLYYSKMNAEGGLGNPVKLKGKINSPLHEGPATIYNNGNSIIFTRNAVTKFDIKNNKDSLKDVNRLMLFSATKNKKNKWEHITPMPFNNMAYSVGHPSITSDGRTLYFASDMPGGYGGVDLYVSYYVDSVWSEPKNLGPSINTAGNEVFPFIYKDTVLYFSSNGHGGLGGLDVFCSIINNNTAGKVKNIGYPINSSLDDFGIIIADDGRSGFFSSNRKKGGSDDDLYQFEIIQVPVHGKVVTKLKDQPVNKAVIRVLYNDEEVYTTKTDAEGKFFLNLQPGKKYVLVVNKEEFKQIRQELSTKNYKEEKYQVSFAIETINKAYVKGVVKSDSSFIKKPIVTYLDKQTGERHTIQGDNQGDFQCEIDSDNEFIFFSKLGDKAGVATLKSTKKKRGSVVFKVDIKLTGYFTHTIKGKVKDSSGLASIGEVRIEDIISGDIEHIVTDSLGVFSFDAKSYAVYNITVRNGDKVGVLKNFSTESYTEPVIEITLFKEEE